MASAITWRDIQSPDYRQSNSLISGAINNFNENAFSGVKELGLQQQELAAKATIDDQQNKANQLYSAISNGGDPNTLGNLNFNGLGAQGAAVASFLQNEKTNFSDIAGTNASTLGQTNINDRYNEVTDADINATNAGAEVDSQKAGAIGIDSLTRGATNQATLQKLQIGNFGDYGDIIDRHKQQQASSPYYTINAKNNSTILGNETVVSGNKALDSGTFTKQYESQLAGDRSLVLGQAANNQAGAYLRTRQGGVVKQDANTRAYAAQSGRISATASRSNANTNRINSKKGNGFTPAQASAIEDIRTSVDYTKPKSRAAGISRLIGMGVKPTMASDLIPAVKPKKNPYAITKNSVPTFNALTTPGSGGIFGYTSDQEELSQNITDAITTTDSKGGFKDLLGANRKWKSPQHRDIANRQFSAYWKNNDSEYIGTTDATMQKESNAIFKKNSTLVK